MDCFSKTHAQVTQQESQVNARRCPWRIASWCTGCRSCHRASTATNERFKGIHAGVCRANPRVICRSAVAGEHCEAGSVFHAQQTHAGDGKQPPLVPRSGCFPHLMRGVRWPARRGMGEAQCLSAQVWAGGARGAEATPDVGGVRAPPGALGAGARGQGEASYPHRTTHWSGRATAGIVGRREAVPVARRSPRAFGFEDPAGAITRDPCSPGKEGVCSLPKGMIRVLLG